MKYIKQKSTNKIIYREEPFSDKTLDSAVTYSGIAKADLEVVEVDWSEDDWVNNSLSYQDKRKFEYPTIVDQLDKIYHDGIDAWKVDMIKPVKDKYPK